MFRKLRDIAAPSGTPFEHQQIGYVLVLDFSNGVHKSAPQAAG
ncbi:hypothetical protein ACWEQH_40520 [Streptomyces sp. NPDC004166]